MPIINRIAEFHDDMKAWRRDIHAHPETAFEEKRTAAVVADTLESLGIEVHAGLATTGVVGVLRGSGRADRPDHRSSGRPRRPAWARRISPSC